MTDRVRPVGAEDNTKSVIVILRAQAQDDAATSAAPSGCRRSLAAGFGSTGILQTRMRVCPERSKAARTRMRRSLSCQALGLAICGESTTSTSPCCKATSGDLGCSGLIVAIPSAKPNLALASARETSRPASRSANPATTGAHEGALLRSLLVVGHGLDDGDPPSPAGEKHGPMGLDRVLDHATRVDLEFSQRDHVFGEFHAHGCRSLGLPGVDSSTCSVVYKQVQIANPLQPGGGPGHQVHDPVADWPAFVRMEPVRRWGWAAPVPRALSSVLSGPGSTSMTSKVVNRPPAVARARPGASTVAWRFVHRLSGAVCGGARCKASTGQPRAVAIAASCGSGSTATGCSTRSSKGRSLMESL